MPCLTNYIKKYDAMSAEELDAANVEVAIAGRMMTRRIMGKASFATFAARHGRPYLSFMSSRDDLA